ncbi:liprin-beta-1 isoform X2 [Phlebotomus argentipes]|uniref:liprin-beta-1 isoform X2 n=1 Tax=Phlebotomus argentipes TaxID=94469 RepID=UPI00289331D7|nr:liprin-beta-1 isoform X2 [Phlebotomus argentipes]XP_059622777.1 liprin-beta-1 isoform X2 [Phlebotomus argentipes]XP_059622778.1 liprin-beta-1 isoform X2 [Phlebotomus argentipes]XP_059622779.1 liprin-beta-1 isoform X2 [Phlebotomus argentipes]XP_059622780.1 liprin-beta-1 isoform X2 [Phlebotomus argentipes]XP_059622781.1 liprin-beta-1 isoform X2 [Phlebotomus argentipes]XP_059622782.1 liprin-beta-1 isoform X2 [Phlebotomus argentipes]XP_059622783.1 liprin-beta-1 isoform X2 [Phlebotomus argenti
MTRWWWFRACNNPSPHENGSLPSATTVEELKGATSSCVNNRCPPNDGVVTSSNVLNAAQTLSTCIQQLGNATPAPDPLTAGIINTWLDTHLPRQDIDERLRRLQSDKESLALQVQVLSEQVAAQNEKISDLERMLTEKTQLLSNADDLLHRVSVFATLVGVQIDKQKEMLSRSSLETQKLELMSAMSELKLQQAALERENLELRTSQINNNSIMNRRPPMAPSRALAGFPATPPPHGTSGGGSLTSTPLGGSHGNLQQHSTSTPATPKTPPASFRRQVDVVHYNSLPRQSFPTATTVAGGGGGQEGASVATTDSNANPKQRNVAFAETEKVIEDNHELSRSFTPQPSPSPSAKAKSSFRSIFGKIRRSNSGTLEDLPASEAGDFRRGGFRSTAGARLGWSGNLQARPERPFGEWDVDSVCSWLEELGLGDHEEEARRWLKHGGVELVKASPVDVEKELGLKSPLHRKKIVLALAEVTGKESDELFRNAGKLDCAWILRWLDDVGLPQHKDTFSAARMDGRMLHKLTMEDLATLHVSSSLHAASLRRGIQVMRDNNFSPDCLIRRSGGEVTESEGNQVTLWTAHRVMEWLRVVDLAEYAPNLRGAGVHGALMMLEPRFNAELLADLLSIPPSKTLLRRHLATHFKELLGRDVIQSKRDAENVLGYTPLTLTAKIKTPKKSQFSLKRKKSSKGGDEWSDYVCPMGSSGDTPVLSSSNKAVSTKSRALPEVVGASEAVSQPPTSDSPTSSRSSAS